MDKESQSNVEPRRYTGLVITWAVIAVFWILLSLPIIFYHLPQVSNAWIVNYLVGLRVNTYDRCGASVSEIICHLELETDTRLSYTHVLTP